MENTSLISPLQATKTEKTCLADFSTLDELYADLAAHLFFSPNSAQSIKGDKGDEGGQGETGGIGPRGEQGIQGDQGLSNYQIWLGIAGNEGKTEAEFIAATTGPTGPAPTATTVASVNVGNGATFTDITGTLLAHYYHLEYDDGTGNPTAMTPPNFPSIGPVVDLGTGYVRVFYTAPPADGNFKLNSVKFS